MKKQMFIASAVIIALLLYGAAREYLTPEWKGYQKEYASFRTGQEGGESFRVEQRQFVLPHMDKIDRCVICHVGMNDPAADALEQPLRAHPGDILEHHDPTRFGCTICHDGQGRALSLDQALGHHVRFWEKPVLLPPFLEANCARCHRSSMPELTGAYQRGERLFVKHGCQGCHKVHGRGGSLGPDLTRIGEASFHLKKPHPDNAHELIERFNGNVNIAYIFESVFEPKIQPESSQMIDYGFSEEEALDLTVYLKSLQEHSIPEGMLAAAGVATTEPGEDLYFRYCSACHGQDGRGSNLREIGKIGPALGNPQFLAIADKEFLTAIISGSGSTIMPAWGAGGGLADAEIEKIASHVLSLRATPPSWEEVRETEAVAAYGRIAFNSNCAGCHGIDGEYETDMIGPTLRSPQLLSLLDERMLYRTLVEGREGTAMPAFGFMKRQELADLMVYMESWRPPEIGLGAFRDAVGQGSVRNGAHYYRGSCAPCHGENREGGVGPSLHAAEFLRAADDRFLHTTLTRGRNGTAMGSYNHLGARTLGDIVAFLRSGYGGAVTGTGDGEIDGSEFRGRKLYNRVCAQCHGIDGSGVIGPAIGSAGFLAAASDRFIWRMAAYGRSGTEMKGNLAGENGTTDLSAEELNNIVSYIRTFEDDPPDLAGRSTIPGEPLKGRIDFAHFCASCHGPGGAGGNGPGIGREGFLSGVSDGFLVAMMMSGREGSEMKPFGMGGTVEVDAATTMGIVHYLRTKDPSEIGRKYVVGTPRNGEMIFNSQCRQCHQGSFAPDLLRPRFVRAASVGYLQATMTLGRHNSAMRSMARGGGGLTELTGKEINDVIAFIKEGKE